MAMYDSSPTFAVKKVTDSPPRIRSMRAHDWVEGAIQIARTERLDGTVHLVGHMANGDLIYRCFDSATSRTEQSLVINWEERRLSCTCWDHKNDYPCPHIGALYLHLLDTMQSALPKNINHHAIYPWWATLHAS